MCQYRGTKGINELMNIIFWMDDPSEIQVNKDTSYALIHECLNRQYQVFYASKQSFSIQINQLHCSAYKFKPSLFGDPLLFDSSPILLTESDIDVCWIRCDPPFDGDYLNHMWMFQLFASDILFMNHPTGIYSTNEKMIIHRFSDFIPKTFVSKSKSAIHDFSTEFDSIILKPLDGYGGSGIFKFKPNDSNIDPAIEQLTSNGRDFIIAQQGLDHSKGDKRILLLNGEPLGAVLRQSNESHRNNFMAGGQAIQTDITDSDMSIVNSIRSYLVEHGLYFVGIDILDGKLTEINVTSPTCLQEMNRLNNVDLHKLVINFMEEKNA